MEGDTEYLDKLINYFIDVHKRNPYSWVPLRKITKTPERFIAHVKYYIDIRTKEYPDVHFSDNYTQLYIG